MEVARTWPASDLPAWEGRPAPTVAAAVADAEIVITMLPDWPEVEEVSQGPFGIFETVKAMSAPVSGGTADAVPGQLPIMVGGQPADFGAATVAESLSWLEPTCGLT